MKMKAWVTKKFSHNGMRMVGVRAALCAVSAFLIVGAASPLCAIDPKPDGLVLIYPLLCPKSGHPLIPPANVKEDIIRDAYSMHFENWFRECSYWTMDTNGNTTHGFNLDTKTFGYIHLPWPIGEAADRTNLPGYLASPPGTYVPFQNLGDTSLPMGPSGGPEPNWEVPPRPGMRGQLYTETDNPLIDGVWTPGEAFYDENGNGVWDPEILAEDRWSMTNNKAPRAWEPSVGTLRVGGFQSRVGTNQWDNRRGELYADYYPNTAVFADNTNLVESVGFDPSVLLYYAYGDEQSNRTVVVSELDLTPFSGIPTAEGDGWHLYMPGYPGTAANIPPNGYFDYNIDQYGNPLVYRATMVGASANTFLTIRYYRWENADGSAYTGTHASSTPGVTRELKVVPIFQAAEIFGQLYASDASHRIRIYIDTRHPESDPSGQWAIWDQGVRAEPFEDFLSWWDPYGGFDGQGGFTYVSDLPAFASVVGAGGQILTYSPTGQSSPDNRGRSDRDTPITYADYVAYITWNYPGDAAALIARAGNGVYDGPDNWRECANNKYRQSGDMQPEMYIADPPSRWDPLNLAGGSWDAWYASDPNLADSAPSWPFTIPNVAEYDPPSDFEYGWTVVTNIIPGQGEVISSNRAGAWMPAIGHGWAYDSAREFKDLPSSLYHRSGDGRLGEITSPFNHSIFGEDRGKDSPYGFDPYDYVYPSAGPYAYNIHGLSGYDAGNLLTLECLTRLTSDPGAAGHSRQFRDTNLDGMIDQGETGLGYPNYLIDYNPLTPNDGDKSYYPAHRSRFLEDCIEATDDIQDYGHFSLPVYVLGLHYPGGGGFRAISGGSVWCLTCDGVFGASLQALSMGAAGEGEEDGEVPTNRISGALNTGFAQATLAHEMGHDWWGLPDYYDYDLANGVIPNYPIGGYDLMANGGLVHGIPATVISRGWSGWQNLTNLLRRNAGPITIEMYPVESVRDQFFYYPRVTNHYESFWFWYYGGNSIYGPPGGRGIYIMHVDGGTPYEFPQQQRLGDHYSYEIVQADGLNHLQDGVNRGDDGDPWPGTSGKKAFSAYTDPPCRWWDQTDPGIKIVNIELPPEGSYAPAKVTFEWYDYSAHVMTDTDSDGDGLPDWWEVTYGLDPHVADGRDGAYADLDNDGLNNYAEYLAGTEPRNSDTDGDGVSDYYEDADGDGVSNGYEAGIGTFLNKVDSDDDGFGDLEELEAYTSPLDSSSPLVLRYIRNDGRGVIRVPYRAGRDEVGRRFNLTNWTVEVAVNLDVAPTNDVILVRRSGGPFGYTTFELGVTTGMLAYARFQSDLGRWYDVYSTTQLVTNTWHWVGGRFGPAGDALGLKKLSIFVDAVEQSQWLPDVVPATGVQTNDLEIGRNLIGGISEVRIWKRPRSDVEIREATKKYLIYGKAGVICGVLENNGAGSAAMDDRNDLHLTRWTVGGWFAGTAGGTVIRRDAGTDGDGGAKYNYRLKILDDGSAEGLMSVQVNVYHPTNRFLTIQRWAYLPIRGGKGLLDGEWHHVAFSFDGTFADLWIDGKRATRVDASDPSVVSMLEWPVTPYDPVRQGCRSWDYALDSGNLVIGGSMRGLIDEVGILGRGSTRADIERIVSETFYGVADLRAYFNFDSLENGVTEIPEVVSAASGGDVGVLYCNNGSRALVSGGTNAPVRINGLSAVSKDLAAYFPMTDGRWTNGAAYVSNSAGVVEDYLHRLDMRYGGTLSNVGWVDFYEVAGVPPLWPNKRPYPNFNVSLGNLPWGYDSDGDGMNDLFEIYYHLDPYIGDIPTQPDLGPSGDPDGDGLSNLMEFYSGTSPLDADSDGDGVSDFWGDADGDGVPNGVEMVLGLRPDISDTDGNGVPDGEEAMDIDTDGDGLSDWWELENGLQVGLTEGDEHWTGDPDNDGLNNYAEYLAGTDPRNSDTDGDGRGDYDSRSNATSRTYGELFMDGDWIDDAWEVRWPSAASPALYDAHMDPDMDGWDNFSEYMAGTDPSYSWSYPTSHVVFTFYYDGNRWPADTPDVPIVVLGYRSEQMDGVPDVVYKVYLQRPSGSRCIVGEEIGIYGVGETYLRGALSRPRIFPGSVEIHAGDSIFKDDTLGHLVGVSGCASTGTIDYSSGAYTLTYNRGVPAGTRVIANYQSLIEGEYLFPYSVYAPDPAFGHLRQGKVYFQCFWDANNNGKWDPGEPLGFSRLMPTEVNWGDFKVDVDLEDTVYGYGRFTWEDTGERSWDVIIRLLNAAGQPIVLSRTIVNATPNIPGDDFVAAACSRAFFHEWDARAAGYTNGIALGPYQQAVYQWFAYPASGGSPATGYFTNRWLSAISAPEVIYPLGTRLVYAHQNEFVWRASISNTQFQISIRRGSSTGPEVFSRTIYPPHRDKQGFYRYVPPIYCGDGPFTNGVYYWRVRAITPLATSSWSADGVFTVDIGDTAQGAYSIAGTVYYYGKVTNNVQLVVQAFDSQGFSGVPFAQVTLSASGLAASNAAPFVLRGLRAGAYVVRAFLDQDGDKELDPTESWGMVKNTSSPNATSYKPESMVLPYNVTKRSIVIRDRDTDNDGLPDGWEVMRFGSIETQGPGTVYSSPPYTDFDGDGVNDWEEYNLDTDPTNADSDGDGISDGDEFLLYKSNPLSTDSDRDGLEDGWEIANGMNPVNPDDDGDGLPTSVEIGWNGVAGYQPGQDLNPMADDSDGDGVNDLMEIAAGSDPLNKSDAKVVAISQIAIDSANQPVIKWNMPANSKGLRVRFTVEYSEDIVNWTEIGYRVSSGNVACSASVTDVVHKAGVGFYRLKLSLEQ